jgi:hypothetical protein
MLDRTSLFQHLDMKNVDEDSECFQRTGISELAYGYRIRLDFPRNKVLLMDYKG